METLATPHFILVDHDSLSIFVCSRIIKRTFPGIEVVLFNSSQEALIYMDTLLSKHFVPQVYLITDLNLPGLSGLEFLEKVKQHPDYRADRVVTYVLSASYDFLNLNDTEHLVTAYIRKPLTTEKVQILFRNYLMESRITA